MAKRGRPRKPRILKADSTLAKEASVALKEMGLKPVTDKQSEARKELLKKIMSDINKKHGITLMQLAKDAPPKTQLSYGITQIDDLTGGIRQGNFTVIYGSPRTGKSTLSYEIIATSQKIGKTCCYIDMERSFDPIRAMTMGVDTQELILVSDCDTAEQAMDIVIRLGKEQVADVVVLDSIQAMSPKGEQFEGKSQEMRSIEDDTMALLARKLGQFFRMCASYIYKANMAIVMIGQVRTQGIGTYMTREGLSGGKGLLHWPVTILYLRHGQGVDAPTEKIVVDGKKKDRKIGFDCVIKLEKTKVSGSKTEGEEVHLPFYFKTGFKK